MRNPLVSILVPVYNAQEYLTECIDSILSQSYGNLQIVLIDDGSKDDSLKICSEYALKDPRIEVYHQENSGVASTRNHLLGTAKGEYVLFVDADDWIELDMVEYLVSLATENSAEMVMCDRLINDAKPIVSQPNINILLQNEAIKDFLYHDYFIGSLGNKLIKTFLLKDKSFNKAISYGEDALFVWNVLQDVDTVVVSTKQLYHYRMNEASISHQSFGDKKLTGHLTWQLITDSVRQSWPQFLDIALGTYALQDMYLLRAASQSSYVSENINILQKTLKTYCSSFRRRTRSHPKELIYGFIISHCYHFGKLYYLIHNLRLRLSKFRKK